MAGVFAPIATQAQAVGQRAMNGVSRARSTAVAAVAVAVLLSVVGAAPAGAAFSSPPPGMMAVSPAGIVAQPLTTGSTTPCFQASFPDCRSSDPRVTFTFGGGDTGVRLLDNHELGRRHED